MTIKIENSIPIPASSGNNKGYSATLRKLKKGQSILMSIAAGAARNAASNALGQGNYATRKMDGGMRIWRIK